MQKFEPFYKLMNKPPEWFALLFWFYPISFAFASFLVTGISNKEVLDIAYPV